MTQIKSEAATIRWRSNGAFTCPMVIRVPIGGYLTGGAIWHSQCGESIFAHVPGLLDRHSRRGPATPPACCGPPSACEDPVLFLEHKHLLRQPYTVDPFPPADYVIPFGARRRRAARATTSPIVTWGATVEKSLQAAARLAEREGIEVEVIDLRTIAPWDHELVAESRGPHGPAARRARGRPHRRLRRRGGGVGRPSTASPTSTPPSAASAPSTPTSPTSPRSRTPSSRRWTTSTPPSSTSARSKQLAARQRVRRS